MGFTLHARRRDNTVRVLLWAAAMVTTAILLFIVGFIIVRGLVSDQRREYPVLDIAQNAISLGGGRGDICVVAHPGTRIADLTAVDLLGLFDGETDNWGDLSGQDLGVEVFSIAGSSPMEHAAAAAIMGRDAAWAPTASRLPDAKAVLERVRDVPGAIGWVPRDALRPSSGVHIVPVRILSLLVHPSITSLEQGRRLTVITSEQSAALIDGRIALWASLGGPDLPVRVLNPLPGEEVGAVERRVAETPGAVAIVPWRDAASTPESILSVQRREVRQNLSLAFFLDQPRRAGKVGGVSTIILNTLCMIVLTLLVATPLGVGAAVYLAEYARQRRLVAILRFATETLAGIPSIIFGLFGFIVFVTGLRMGIGMLSGTLTITMMVLPTIVRTAEESLLSVPAGLRAGSLSLGATKWQTTIRVIVPAASPGILTGIILAVGRAVGETAALLFTMGTDYRLVQGLRSSARVLSVHLYYLLKEGISFDRAFATATILIIIILVVNLVTTRLIGRMNLLRTEGIHHGHTR